MRRALVLVLLAACTADAEQHEITEPGELLNDDGTLREPGWAPTQLLHWDLSKVADPDRLRMWDFVTLQDDHAAVNLTMVDLSFLHVASVGVVDLDTGEAFQSMALLNASQPMTLSDAVFGDATAGDVMSYQGGVATFAIPASSFGDASSGEITVTYDGGPYLSLATPFDEDPHEFFFEQKVPALHASGTVTVGARTWTFDAADATIDWGRGEWPATATWRWAAGAGDGIAFNLGNGFGNPRAGSENIAFAGGAPAKLATVDWTYDPDDPLADWHFDAPDDRAHLVLHPVAPETGGLDLGSVYSRLHKGYGTFTGTITLDDGTVVTVDGARGFAEQEDLSW